MSLNLFFKKKKKVGEVIIHKREALEAPNRGIVAHMMAKMVLSLWFGFAFVPDSIWKTFVLVIPGETNNLPELWSAPCA